MSRILAVCANLVLVGGCLAQSVGCRRAIPACTQVEFRLAEESPARGLIAKPSSNGGPEIYLYRKVELGNADILGVEAQKQFAFDPKMILGKPEFDVVMTFTGRGSERLHQVTSQNRGKVLAILVDGQVVTDSVIHGNMSDSIVIYDKNMSQEKAEKLAHMLNSRCRPSRAP